MHRKTQKYPIVLKDRQISERKQRWRWRAVWHLPEHLDMYKVLLRCLKIIEPVPWMKAISKAPGVGAKTAQKVILELKDKLKLEDILDSVLRALNYFPSQILR